MRSIIRCSTIIVIVHALVIILHGLAHSKIPVSLSPFQSLFVGLVIVIAPIAAMFLLWTPFQRMGSQLLLGSMAGALVFGGYFHFMMISPDHISQVPFVGWGIIFRITAILLPLVEGIGCVVGAWGVIASQERAQML
jgi:hypothetical protein